MDRVHALWERASAHTESLVVMKSRQMMGKAGFTRDDLDAIRQDLRMTVWRRLHLFDPSRGVLEAFVTTVVESAVKQILRDRRRLKRGGGRRPVPLDGMPDIADKARQILDGCDRRARVDAVKLACDDLPPDLIEVAVMRASMSISQIVRLTGRRRRDVLNDLTFIRAHLEARGIDEEI